MQYHDWPLCKIKARLTGIHDTLRCKQSGELALKCFKTILREISVSSLEYEYVFVYKFNNPEVVHVREKTQRKKIVCTWYLVLVLCFTQMPFFFFPLYL